MQTTASEVLQDIHTATNDVLKGYREMAERARQDIQPVIHRLVALHERHAAEQAALLSREHEDGIGDTSAQGTLNKAVVIVRDWFTDLDRDTLPAVRKGEEALRDEYAKALRNEDAAADPALAALLRTQMAAVQHEIASLPR